VDLRCFPFDVQALPIKLKARRCHGLAFATPAAGSQCAFPGRVDLAESSGMLFEESYWARDACLRGQGNYILETAGDSLLEFNMAGLTGRFPNENRRDFYEACVFVKRPFLSSYFWHFLLLNLVVMLAATAFWDAAPELSSRMSISLTMMLTLAAYTSSRPLPIKRATYVTFHDWCEQISMLLVTGISIQNVVVVVSCGGQHEVAHPYLAEEFERHGDKCELGWCMSRKLDCSGLTLLLVMWLLLGIYSVFWLIRLRRASASASRQNLGLGQKEAPGKRTYEERCCRLRNACGSWMQGHASEQCQPEATQPEGLHRSVKPLGDSDGSLAAAVAAAFEAFEEERGSLERRPRPEALGCVNSRSCSPPMESREEDEHSAQDAQQGASSSLHLGASGSLHLGASGSLHKGASGSLQQVIE